MHNGKNWNALLKKFKAPTLGGLKHIPNLKFIKDILCVSHKGACWIIFFRIYLHRAATFGEGSDRGKSFWHWQKSSRFSGYVGLKKGRCLWKTQKNVYAVENGRWWYRSSFVEPLWQWQSNRDITYWESIA